MYRQPRINNRDNQRWPARQWITLREKGRRDVSRVKGKRNYLNAISATDVNKWESCKSKVLPAVRIFHGWRASAGGWIEKGELHERKDGRGIEPSGEREDEWKRAGKKSCKKRDLPSTLPSLHSLAPWHENSATPRSLSARTTLRRLHREDIQNREIRRALNVGHGYIWQRKEFLFLCLAIPSISRSSAFFHVNILQMNLCRWCKYDEDTFF